ncbi:MAG: TIGR03960 family B12-binding radical SAM protein [Clostridia bacterium]|nr:TIGR03960 family B12-binding radical SAM protein [Clostridia bacterium]
MVKNEKILGAVTPLLSLVQKPASYTGTESNLQSREFSRELVSYALCFPDFYDIGMSHLGVKILYSLVNSREDCTCERVFAPREDMESLMRENGVPLYGLETFTPVSEFDLVGFSLQYEPCYTNVLNMLDLAGLPVRSADRKELLPVVIAGGPCCCNPEPMADFIDLFMLGDGEEATADLLDLIKSAKTRGLSKKEFLAAAASIPGVYVPSLYEVSYNADGTVERVSPAHGADETVLPVKKAVVRDLDSAFFPEKFVVPLTQTVFDRATVELFRGCTRGCRFCQAGFINRPIRVKSAEKVNRDSLNLCRTSGYDEISLCSLSTSDYPQLPELLELYGEWIFDEKINVSLPSLRADNFPASVIAFLSRVRKSGVTFAAEAGSQRLRDVINKNVSEEEILSAAQNAFADGRTNIKMYFMLGLPTETDGDVLEILRLAHAVCDLYYKNENRPKGRGVSVAVSAASFVPKPFTPFQWEAQCTKEELERKKELLTGTGHSKKITFGFNMTDMSVLEGALARGDRRLGAVIETVWRMGAKYDAWDDFFKPDLWAEAFEKNELDPSFYAARKRDYDEVLPWDHLDYGVSREYLRMESEKARKGQTTPRCDEKCAACGAARLGSCAAQKKPV